MIITINLEFANISDDPSARFAGIGIDEPLVPSWWTNRPSQNIRTVDWGHLSLTKTVDLSEGQHTVEVGVSSGSVYAWGIDIIIQEITIVSGTTEGGSFVSGSFYIDADGKVSIAPLLKPIDKLKNLFQRLKSFFNPPESIEAYK